MRTSVKWIVFVLFLSALAGCGKEKFSVPDQRAAFLTYLKSRGSVDTVQIDGVYRVFTDQPAQPGQLADPTRKERLLAAAPELIDTGAVVTVLGGKIAGNPLADAPELDSLRAWAARLREVGTWLNGKTTEWNKLDLGPSLDFALLNLDVAVDSLIAAGTRLSSRAEAAREDRDILRAFSEQTVFLGGLVRQAGEKMQQVAAWPDPGRIAPGDSVDIYYSGHIFDKTNGVGERFTSNVEPIHNLSGADAFPLLPDPTRLRVGDEALIRGIDIGLQGDIVQNCFQLFLSADLAYGERYIGLVPTGSPVVFRIEIREVIKP